MRLLHTGDLHIGKILYEFSLLEDQRNILKQISKIAEEEKVDGVILAGDLYDRTIPAKEAVLVLDEFLTGLINMGKQVFAINGNHDSGERLSFVNTLLEEKGLYLAGKFENGLKKVIWQDEYGSINIYLMPFVKPVQIREWAGWEGEGFFYQQAAKAILSASFVNPLERNVLIAHHFVTDSGREPKLSDSDSRVQVGGTDQVEASLFSAFDYTALGHIHRPQQIGEKPVYYAGSPLKYSFSEAGQEKSVLLIDLKEKGNLTVTKRALTPLHDMRRIKGKLAELIQKDVVNAADREDYLSVTLTDKEELFDPIRTLRSVYPNVMQLILEKNEEQEEKGVSLTEDIQKKSSLELFSEFYEQVQGEKPDEERLSVVKEALLELEGEVKCDQYF